LGNAGTITLNARGSILLQTSGVLGKAGGRGNAGSITIGAGQLSLASSEISCSATGTGQAGGVAIQAGQLSLADSLISCSANQGKAGDISLQSGNSLTLDNSSIGVDSAQGNAGTITLQAPGTMTLQDSKLQAKAQLDGGNITIDPQIFGLVNSSLNANAVLGNGGHISVTADFSYQLGNWSITADSQNQSAQPGTISINSAVDFANVLSALPVSPLQEGSRIREGCARKNPRANSLIVRGKGGVAARPDAFLPVYDSRLEPINGL
jgi:hypothetical protein